ncbi:MAG: DUF3630 family protein [Nonlabens ulvanivorans]|uniref:DUF3630 family protein n=1 Tax=Nonlabens ulvanivorans TaxID=906888 RepID=UPI003262F08F
MSTQNISYTLTLIDDNSLQINFTDAWYQEDTPSLTAYLFEQLGNCSTLEVILGADRENCRFEWQQNYFILNFECYSQSCWIENETATDLATLNVIKQQLENN